MGLWLLPTAAPQTRPTGKTVITSINPCQCSDKRRTKTYLYFLRGAQNRKVDKAHCLTIKNIITEQKDLLAPTSGRKSHEKRQGVLLQNTHLSFYQNAGTDLQYLTAYFPKNRVWGAAVGSNHKPIPKQSQTPATKQNKSPWHRRGSNLQVQDS